MSWGEQPGLHRGSFTMTQAGAASPGGPQSVQGPSLATSASLHGCPFCFRQNSRPEITHLTHRAYPVPHKAKAFTY